MNWKQYQVSERAFSRLVEDEEPIRVADGILTPNAGIEIFTLAGGRYDAIYDMRLGAIRKLKPYNPVFDSVPNRDVALFNDHLLNRHINTIVVDGFFGTGKTSTTCSHLVHKLTQGLYAKKDGIPIAYLAKPHESLGKSHGHLPGTLAEKTEPEFQSFFQYFERFGQPYLLEKLMPKDEYKSRTKQMLYVLTFEYLRGRDINEGWIILDESQNTSEAEMAAFISRVGDEAKLILLGDTSPTQIDKRGNTPDNNGLTFAKRTYFGKEYAGYVTMQTVDHILRGQRLKDMFLALKG